MNRLAITAGVALIICATGAQAQRRASITGGGTNDSGSCTVRVWVDGAAEVNVRGDSINARDLQGQQPQIRDFQCTSPMPPNPVNLRYRQLEGRGRQEMVQANNGNYVFRIEDRDGGGDNYAFQLTWGQAFNNGPNAYRNDQNRDYYEPNRDYRDNRGNDYYRGGADRLAGAELAVDSCRSAVITRLRRDGYRDIDFGSVRMDDNPGRFDRVIGDARAERRFGRDFFGFSCSVNLRNGNVRAVDLRRR